MEILNQLGGLVLGSVPTAIFLIALVVLYRILVSGPLERTLDERRKRTSGAVDQARSAIATAEAETAAYENKLRAARAEIAKAREQRLKALHVERDSALEAARAEAQALVRTAQQEIEASSVAARKQVEDASDELGKQILRALLPSQVNVAEAIK